MTLLIGKLTRSQLKTKFLQTKISSGFLRKNFFWFRFQHFAVSYEVIITMRRAMEQSSTTDCLYRRQLQKLIPSITGAVESEMQAQHNSVEILDFTEEPKYQLQTGQNSGFICF